MHPQAGEIFQRGRNLGHGCRFGDLEDHKIYTHTRYSNFVAGLTANVDDGLAVLRSKYASSVNAAAHGNISQQEMRNISAVYRYNQGAPFKTQAIFLALDPTLTNADIRNYLVLHGALQTYVMTYINDAWLDAVRQTCPVPQYSQMHFLQCLAAAEDATDVHGHALSTSAFYLENVASELPLPFADLAQKMQDVNTSQTILWLASPAELRVTDAQGNVTGVVNGATVENAVNSVFDADLGVATVFFPDGSYRYTVQGTSAGVYGFVATDFATGETVALKNIPITPAATHTYSIDWAALARGEKGVTVTIYQNGVVTDVVKIGATLDDAQPPTTTTAAISGTAGRNGWYVSDVTIALNATDGAGIGVKSTTYSLDSGPWQTASTPINIDTEGVHTLQYFSTDFFGNREVTHMLTLKIDKTPPAITGLPVNCALWPPNHKMVQVATVSASDGVSGLASFAVTGASNEPASPGESDVAITGAALGPRTVQLRAERLGSGSGRVYTLTAMAQDVAGNNATATATCIVPHDQSK